LLDLVSCRRRRDERDHHAGRNLGNRTGTSGTRNPTQAGDQRHIRTIQLTNDALLILIGFALLTKQLAVIARWAQENNLYLEAGSLGGTTPTFFIAILAGLLSFLSPCVLSLVPAYIFYLTGRTISKTTAN